MEKSGFCWLPDLQLKQLLCCVCMTGQQEKVLEQWRFVLFYVIYVIGYTIVNMTAQTIPPLMTNDPRQRPTLGVWVTALNYMVPMVLTIVLNVVMLPKFGGTYNQEFLSAACKVCLLLAAIGIVLVCIGVSEYDKPENFRGLTKEREPLKSQRYDRSAERQSSASVLYYFCGI